MHVSGTNVQNIRDIFFHMLFSLLYRSEIISDGFVIMKNNEIFPTLALHCKKIGCFNHKVVTLVAGDSGYVKFILVLGVNCISKLSPNHTL